MTKKVFTISKKWNHPEFKYIITDEGMSCEMDFEDFKKALKQEIGSITWTFKRETFEKKLDKAIQIIIDGAKEESSKLVSLIGECRSAER